MKATDNSASSAADESAITQIQPALTGIPPRVLVVDDDEIAREHLGTLVSASGYEVSVAASGAAALESLRREFSPIVILAPSPENGD